MVRTQIQLTEAQAKAVKRAALEEGTSVAEVIRRAVERMAEARPKMSAQERVRRAIEIAGKFRSDAVELVDRIHLGMRPADRAQVRREPIEVHLDPGGTKGNRVKGHSICPFHFFIHAS